MHIQHVQIAYFRLVHHVAFSKPITVKLDKDTLPVNSLECLLGGLNYLQDLRRLEMGQ